MIESGWLPPLASPISAIDIANGADSRFVLSVGPFDLNPGESVPVTFGLFTAASFHRDPDNFSRSFPTPSDFQLPANILAYRRDLDLGGVIANGRMVRKIFDNDTESFLVFCKFVFNPITGTNEPVFVTRFHGDGIPDFKGPIPPSFPKVELSTGEGEVTIRWFGKETETAVDPISGLRDFEGYSVQMSPDGVNYTIIGYWDKVNYRGWYLNRDINQDGLEYEFRWEPLPSRPLYYGEIQNLYAFNWDTCVNKPGNIVKPIDPKKYSGFISRGQRQPFTPSPNPWCNPDTGRTAVRVRFCDACGPFVRRVDTIFTFFPEGLNLGLEPIRMYPAVTDPENDSAYWYQYKISGLFPSQPVYFAVVPFDNGWANVYQSIEPQAASPYAGAYLVYPIASDSARRAEGLKVSVYPNPYRIDHDYSFFEKRLPSIGNPQSSKRLNFINLPSRCTIRIYTLDGDLVQQINHDKDPNASDSGYEFWDLLSRNAQPVASGLYIFVVESSEGQHVGKMLIIQ